MIVDTSALVAIALGESTARDLLRTLSESESNRISAANLLEAWIVIDSRGIRDATNSLESLIERMVMQVEPVTYEQVLIARTAFQQYGKGSGHGARLNFGDCFAYALAKERNESLLFVGNDFSKTDITSATEQHE